MAENSGIGWVGTYDKNGVLVPGNTFNGWFGCEKIDTECKHCYAEEHVTGRLHLPVWGPAKTTVRHKSKPSNWKLPLKWNRKASELGVRKKVFCSSLSDVFEDHPMLPEWRAELFELIRTTPHLDWLLLSKRPENMPAMLPKDFLEKPWANVWLGTTVGTPKGYKRVEALTKVPARVRFLSCEPLLEEIDLAPWLEMNTYCSRCQHATPGHAESCEECGDDSHVITTWGHGQLERAENGDRYDPEHKLDLEGPAIHWVIVGGESGDHARSMELRWAYALQAQAKQSETAFFFKQLGCKPLLDGVPYEIETEKGKLPSEWPKALRVQEFPLGG